jgi:TadE-like protein
MSDRGRPGDRGSVTAEIAVALPALVVLVMAALSAVAVAIAQLRCVDAAREAARAAARGDALPVVRGIARHSAPPQAAVTVTAHGDQVSVAVSANVRLLSGRAPAIAVEGRAVAAIETGSTGVGR